MKPWEKWEDWNAGLYLPGPISGELVQASADLLADPDVFHETAHEMLREWPVSARQNLQFMWSGRNAWVGQASCCYAHGAPAAATRMAWGQITETQQQRANRVAAAVRSAWEKEMQDGQTLFTR